MCAACTSRQPVQSVRLRSADAVFCIQVAFGRLAAGKCLSCAHLHTWPLHTWPLHPRWLQSAAHAGPASQSCALLYTTSPHCASSARPVIGSNWPCALQAQQGILAGAAWREGTVAQRLTRGYHSDAQHPAAECRDASAMRRWCAAVQRLPARPRAIDVNRLAASLATVEKGAVAANVSEVLPLVERLVQCTPGDKRKASMLDALASSLQAHPPLLQAVAADKQLCVLLDWALELAAGDDETYRNELCTAQMATAQGKLGRYCAPFWRRLEQRGVPHLGPRELVTVLHRAASLLTSAAGAQPPTPGLLAALKAALIGVSRHMSSQEVCNALWALATLGVPLTDELRTALLAGALRESSRMNSQNVANALLALAKLQVPLTGELRVALLAAALRESLRFDSQNVSNVLLALAKLEVPLTGELRAALLAAALRESLRFDSQGVANVLLALAKLEVPLTGKLAAALLAAALHKSPRMNSQEVANVLWALVKLEVPLAAELRAALLAAALRESPRMNSQNVANVLWALATLSAPLTGEPQDALLAAALREAERMNEQDVSNSLWALATLGIRPDGQLRPALLHALEREAPSMLPAGKRMSCTALKRFDWPVSDAVREALRSRNDRFQVARRSFPGRYIL